MHFPWQIMKSDHKHKWIRIKIKIMISFFSFKMSTDICPFHNHHDERCQFDARTEVITRLWKFSVIDAKACSFTIIELDMRFFVSFKILGEASQY